MTPASAQRGSAIVVALIAMLSMSLICVVVYGYFLNLQKNQNRQNLLKTVSQIQANIANTIYSDDAFSKTILITNNPIPPAGSWVQFKLLDANGTIVYDSTNPQSGFSAGGTACYTWSSSGSPSCPLHLDLQWQQVPNCVPLGPPAIKFMGTYTYSPGGEAQTPINWQYYSGQLSVCRPIAIQSSSNFNCAGAPPTSSCSAPETWYCSSTGWKCGQVYN